MLTRHGLSDTVQMGALAAYVKRAPLVHPLCRRWIHRILVIFPEIAGKETPMDLKKLTARQTANYHYMADAMRRLEWDLHNHIEGTARIPPEWHEIAQRQHDQPTERVTVRLDRDVLRFFRSMGAGYGPRLNEVLRSYMHARLAGLIKGADTTEFHRRQREVHDGERPVWGETGALLGEGEVAAEDVRAEGRARAKEGVRAKWAGREV